MSVEPKVTGDVEPKVTGDVEPKVTGDVEPKVTGAVELKVSGMSCEHCVKAVTQAIRAQDPAADVRVDLGAGTVRAHTALPRDAVAQAVEEEGYSVTG